MKTELKKPAIGGLILSCLMLLSSCAELVCMDDQRKLAELEQQHRQNQISNRDYKREKARLVTEIKANQTFINEERGPLITIGPSSNGDEGSEGDGR